jgi:hypothetical protein
MLNIHAKFQIIEASQRIKYSLEIVEDKTQTINRI